jgi:CheY-like chemotaxis protein
LLGGRIAVKSKPGAGSTFSAIIPRLYKGPAEVVFAPEVAPHVDPGRLPVLVVEDNRETLFIYEKYLRGTAFQIIPAQNLAAARRALASLRPIAIVLDVLLDHESGWDLLGELKETEATRNIPVLVVTLVENEHKARSMGAEAYCAKPMERAWLLNKLNQLTPPRFENVLLIDDDEASRYLLRGWLAGTGANVAEASNGAEGLRFARAEPPDLVFLDLELPDQSGVQVLGALRSTPATHDVAVIINTSKVLDDDERQGLFKAGATAVLSKAMLAAEGGRDLLRESLRKARADHTVRQH